MLLYTSKIFLIDSQTSEVPAKSSKCIEISFRVVQNIKPKHRKFTNFSSAYPPLPFVYPAIDPFAGWVENMHKLRCITVCCIAMATWLTLAVIIGQQKKTTGFQWQPNLPCCVRECPRSNQVPALIADPCFFKVFHFTY